MGDARRGISADSIPSHLNVRNLHADLHPLMVFFENNLKVPMRQDKALAPAVMGSFP